MMAGFAANWRWKFRRNGSTPSERLAVAVDELRKARGHAVILRGHDFRLRDAPREMVAREVANIISPASHREISAPAGAGRYVPLRAHSHYSFLDSTLSPAAIVELAKRHGLPAVALTDTGNLHGAVEFVLAAKQAGIKPILGAELCAGDKPLLLYVESARGYHNLCRLLSRHAENMAATSDEASVAAQQRRPFRRGELDGLTEGLIAVSEDARLAELFPGRFYGLATAPGKSGRFLAAACPAIRYATPQDRQKYDIVQSIRTLTLLREEHPEKRRGGCFHFRAPAEMAAACQEHPAWLRLHTGNRRAVPFRSALSANRNSRPSPRRTARRRMSFCAVWRCRDYRSVTGRAPGSFNRK